mmetsp:Transcript_27310/g.71454  ORF Transcript_27310/g.71454 Transcript_27310/m.71454 type:complete len:305 (+) Transcript_27310:48-962(+)
MTSASIWRLIAALGCVLTLGLKTVDREIYAPPLPEGLQFIRIQKTGGTSFGEHVMPELCKGKCAGHDHLDWNHVDHNTNTMTMIRDPVERTLSEFFFMRTQDGKNHASQSQWNFNNNTWLRYVQEEPDVDDALEVYLSGYPFNPSINRQSMYILGLGEGVGATAGIHAGDRHAGERYLWTKNHDVLVEQVRAHLDKLVVFGIADCFETSMEVIATRLGWPVAKTLELASMHSRKQNKPLQASSLLKHAPLTSVLELARIDQVNVKWRDVVGPEIVQRIQEQNAVDMELFSYAKQRFSERFGTTC